MKIKTIVIALVLLIAVIGITGCGPAPQRETLVQISTIDAILNGVYDGVMTIGDLKKYGDFGIGTFAGLDGEMLVLDGVVYQIKADGVAYVVNDDVTTPFASVTYFDIDAQYMLPSEVDYLQCQSYINSYLPTGNIFYAFKITGTFSYMKTRSVPAQHKPYPPLVEVTKDQPIFEFTNVKGTIVGFYCPTYVEGVNVTGYHLHFLTDSKDAGGHVLDFIINSATVYIDYTSEFTMILPGPGSDFYQLDLSPDLSGDLDQAEK